MTVYFCSDENVQLISQVTDWQVSASSSREFISFISECSTATIKPTPESSSVVVLMFGLTTLQMISEVCSFKRFDPERTLNYIIENINQLPNIDYVIIVKPSPFFSNPTLLYLDQLNGFAKLDIYKFFETLDSLSLDRRFIKVIDLGNLLSIDNSKHIKNIVRSNSRLHHKNIDLFLGHIKNAIVSCSRKSLPKVIALDLDNTLWNGVLREDGIDNLNIGDLSPLGQLFNIHQKLFKMLKNNGLLLVLITKNFPEDVAEAFTRLPDMPLKLDDFIIIKASDSPKSMALLECSLELNIALEHFLFIDDSPFERREVLSNCPDIYIPDLPTNIYEWIPFLLADPSFSALLDMTQFSAESRTDLYKSRALRTENQNAYLNNKPNDLDNWLSSLDQTLTAIKLEQPTQRTVELFQRTNQFNTSRLRFTKEELSDLLINGHSLFEFRLSDFYGDDGVVSSVLIDHSSAIPTIKNFVLSCRVFGRHVEHAIVFYLLNWVITSQKTDQLKFLLSTHSTNRTAATFFKPLLDGNSCLISSNLVFKAHLIKIVS